MYCISFTTLNTTIDLTTIKRSNKCVITHVMMHLILRLFILKIIFTCFKYMPGKFNTTLNFQTTLNQTCSTAENTAYVIYDNLAWMETDFVMRLFRCTLRLGKFKNKNARNWTVKKAFQDSMSKFIYFIFPFHLSSLNITKLMQSHKNFTQLSFPALTISDIAIQFLFLTIHERYLLGRFLTNQKGGKLLMMCDNHG